MSTATVYRPELDWKGNRPKDLEDSLLGPIDGVIVGGNNPRPLGRFPGVVSTAGQIGIPKEQDSNILVQQGDYVVISGIMYRATGPRQWEESHVFSGTDALDDYYWIDVEATRGVGVHA